MYAVAHISLLYTAIIVLLFFAEKLELPALWLLPVGLFLIILIGLKLKVDEEETLFVIDYGPDGSCDRMYRIGVCDLLSCCSDLYGMSYRVVPAGEADRIPDSLKAEFRKKSAPGCAALLEYVHDGIRTAEVRSLTELPTEVDAAIHVFRQVKHFCHVFQTAREVAEWSESAGKAQWKLLEPQFHRLLALETKREKISRR